MKPSIRSISKPLPLPPRRPNSLRTSGGENIIEQRRRNQQRIEELKQELRNLNILENSVRIVEIYTQIQVLMIELPDKKS